jgi:hypothetical protein
MIDLREPEYKVTLEGAEWENLNEHMSKYVSMLADNFICDVHELLNNAALDIDDLASIDERAEQIYVYADADDLLKPECLAIVADIQNALGIIAEKMSDDPENINKTNAYDLAASIQCELEELGSATITWHMLREQLEKLTKGEK